MKPKPRVIYEVKDEHGRVVEIAHETEAGFQRAYIPARMPGLRL
jgi:hypothetical protein